MGQRGPGRPRTAFGFARKAGVYLLRWGDGNGYSHVRAALMGPSLVLPVSGGRVEHGTWQQIVLIDSDTRSRRRIVHMSIVGVEV